MAADRLVFFFFPPSCTTLNPVIIHLDRYGRPCESEGYKGTCLTINLDHNDLTKHETFNESYSFRDCYFPIAGDARRDLMTGVENNPFIVMDLSFEVDCFDTSRSGSNSPDTRHCAAKACYLCPVDSPILNPGLTIYALDLNFMRMVSYTTDFGAARVTRYYQLIKLISCSGLRSFR